MTQYDVKEAAEAKTPETKPSQGTMGMCPMAKMCMGMMERRPSGLLLMFPGVLLIGVGVLIVIEPKILVWLMAVASVLLGSMLLVMAGFIRRMRMGAQLPMH